MVKDKVLIVAATGYMVNQFLKPSIELLIKQNYEVHLAVNLKKPGPISSIQIYELINYLKIKDVTVHEIDFPRNPTNIIKVLKSINKLNVVMKNNNFRFVHSHTPTGGLIGRIVLKKYRKKGTLSIYTAHGFHFYKGAPLKNWLLYYPIEKLLSFITDIILTINDEDYTITNEKMKAKKVIKLNGVGVKLSEFSLLDKNKPLIRKKYGYEMDTLVLIYVAEINSNKNQIMLVDTVNVLKEKYQNIKLVLVGDDSNSDDLKKYINDLNLNRIVDILGFRNDIVELYALSDFVVASSKREGLPVNIIEAMAMGIPIVATNIRGHKDLLKNEYYNVLVEINDHLRMAQLIDYIYENTKVYNAIKEINYTSSINYSVEEVNKDLETIYIQIKEERTI